MLKIPTRPSARLSQLVTLCAALTLFCVVVKSQESAPLSPSPALELGVEVSGAAARPHVFPARTHGGKV